MSKYKQTKTAKRSITLNDGNRSLCVWSNASFSCIYPVLCSARFEAGSGERWIRNKVPAASIYLHLHYRGTLENTSLQLFVLLVRVSFLIMLLLLFIVYFRDSIILKYPIPLGLYESLSSEIPHRNHHHQKYY